MRSAEKRRREGNKHEEVIIALLIAAMALGGRFCVRPNLQGDGIEFYRNESLSGYD